jgi:SAM-dependent methyltransferase
MDSVNEARDEQARLWNGVAGCAWVELQDLVDAAFRPLEALLVEGVAAGAEVLDVGCGTGGTTLAVARRLGGTGRCVGIDISEPMLTAARARALREGMPARFVRADAETYLFEAQSFDAIISRFGVMFFGDPVRAFGNLRGAAREGAKLRFIAWRSAAENPFMTTAERAAAPYLPDMPGRDPDAPGQFAFADRRRVERILTESGWGEIDIRPVDVPCTLPEAGLERYFTRLGPLGRVLPAVDEGTRTKIVETVRAAFQPYVRGAEVSFTAACWLVDARAIPAPAEAARG